MYGDRVHQAVKENKENLTGATIHFVSEEYDKGEIIAQVSVDLTTEESSLEIAEKVFQAECDLYPKVLTMLASNKLPKTNNKIMTYNFSRGDRHD